MVSHRWREMAAWRWSVTPVRNHGRLTQHGRKCDFFFFLFFSLRWMMDSSTAAMAARAAPINSASLPSHTYWTVTDSPIQDPSGSWKVQLTANSRTFSNRCCRASFTLKSLTLGAAFTAALSPLLRAAFGKQPDRFYAVAQYDEMALNNNRYSI